MKLILTLLLLLVLSCCTNKELTPKERSDYALQKYELKQSTLYKIKNISEFICAHFPRSNYLERNLVDISEVESSKIRACLNNPVTALEHPYVHFQVILHGNIFWLNAGTMFEFEGSNHKYYKLIKRDGGFYVTNETESLPQSQ